MVDTTVLIDVMRGSTCAVDWLRSLPQVPLCSEISRTEVIRGLGSGERSRAEVLFGLLEWVPVTERVSRQAGDLGRQYRRSHQGIGPADLVVAASALVHDVEPATHNVKHFPMFPGLRPPY